MAERFARGGKLVALGASPAARSDARHVAVEFVHPVIVGKRALPAIALTAEGETSALRPRRLVESDDIVIAFGARRARRASGWSPRSRARASAEALTIAFEAGSRRLDLRGRRATTRSCARR